MSLNNKHFGDWQRSTAEIILKNYRPETVSTVFGRASKMTCIADDSEFGEITGSDLTLLGASVRAGSTLMYDSAGLDSLYASARVRNHLAELTGGAAINLGITLYQQLGDEVLELAFALASTGGRFCPESLGTTRVPGSKNGERQLAKEEMKSFLDDCVQNFGFETDGEDSLRFALGDHCYLRHSARGDTTQNLRNSIEGSPEFGERLRQAAGIFAKAPDRVLAEAIVHRSFERWAGIDCPTDWDDMLEQKRLVEGWERQVAESPSPDPRVLRDISLHKLVLKRFFEANPEPERERLVEVIDCERYRNELHALKGNLNLSRLLLKQLEIVTRVLGEVQRFRYEIDSSLNYTKNPNHVFPAYVAKDKHANCFTGPWLIASLLLRCGFTTANLFYGHRNISEHHCEVTGKHSVLFFRDASGRCYSLNHMSFPITEVDFKQYQIVGNNTLHPEKRAQFAREKLQRIAEGSGERLHLRAEMDGDNEGSIRFRPDYVVMSLEDGFAGGHFLHTGLTFFEEGCLEEAEYSFDLASTFFGDDPSILCAMEIGRAHV